MACNISDMIIQNDKRYFKYRSYQDSFDQYKRQIDSTILQQCRDIDRESFLLFQNDIDCRWLKDKTRVGNAKSEVCNIAEKTYIGYDNYNALSLNEYLLIPCKHNTYRNQVSCGIDTCCSTQHQLFMNCTRKNT